ncbi:MAG: type II toxin-antitoxin system VapB family antitoxin [Mesorhizobium sp.]|nr:type II toxin-antitoxin system VapB family antitoxin [Mesorhizobium sp.]
MALFIRDDTVNALATELQRVTNAPSKTEAVRLALQNELERRHRRKSFMEGLAKAMALADAMGPSDHDVDMKVFFDDLCGDI